MAGIRWSASSVADPREVLREQRRHAARAARRDAGAGDRRLVFSSDRRGARRAEEGRSRGRVRAPAIHVTPYGETKLALERALRWYEAAPGIHSVSLRYFNAAGASERSGERHDPETHLIPLGACLQAAERPRASRSSATTAPTATGTCVRLHPRHRPRARRRAALGGPVDGAYPSTWVAADGDGSLEVLGPARAVTRAGRSRRARRAASRRSGAAVVASFRARHASATRGSPRSSRTRRRRRARVAVEADELDAPRCGARAPPGPSSRIGASRVASARDVGATHRLASRSRATTAHARALDALGAASGRSAATPPSARVVHGA